VGDLLTAERLFRQALDAARVSLDETHPQVAQILINLGRLYVEMGKYAAALPLLMQATRLLRAALGEAHPAFAASLNHLAALYQAMGDHVAALATYEQALEIRRSARGEARPDFDTEARNLNNLAELYRGNGNHVAAQTLSRQVLAALPHDPHEPEYARALDNLVASYLATGDHAAALELLREQRELLREQWELRCLESATMGIPRDSPEVTREPDPAEQRSVHTDVSFPATVRVGKTYHLRVQLVPAEETLPTGGRQPIPKRHPHDVSMNLAVAQPVHVSVTAENFEIEGDDQTDLVVSREGRSQAALFRLRGESVGPGRIMIDFEQNRCPVGSVDLFPDVVAACEAEAIQTAPAHGGVGLGAGGSGAAPDLVIKVFECRCGGGAGRLRFVCSSPHRQLRDLPVLEGDLGTLDLRVDTGSWVAEQLGLLGELAGQQEPTAEAVSQALAKVGCNLYDQLLPPTLKDLCWTFRRRGVKSLLILSDEPHIPWELIKPYRVDSATGVLEAEDDFWGATFALTHWLRGRPPAQQLSAQRIVAFAAGWGPRPAGESATHRNMVVADTTSTSPTEAPASPGLPALPCANAELAALCSLEALGARIEVHPLRRQHLQEAFERGTFDVLHLAAHGSFGGTSAADRSAVITDDGLFRAADLSPRLLGHLRRSEPLIVFNTCDSGRLGFSLTRLGSWGATFVHLGCGAFVGTLWPVTDEAALEFARSFYLFLAQGFTIGEAMMHSRLAVRRRRPNDPTWLAYCCFADPQARLVGVDLRRGPRT
jgi:tetratricopeptide (TPR) repeat protein